MNIVGGDVELFFCCSSGDSVEWKAALCVPPLKFHYLFCDGAGRRYEGAAPGIGGDGIAIPFAVMPRVVMSATR